MVKNLPAKQETSVRSLGWEDPLEKKKTTHSSILAWRIPWTFTWDAYAEGVFILRAIEDWVEGLKESRGR